MAVALAVAATPIPAKSATAVNNDLKRAVRHLFCMRLFMSLPL
jgi:hypothetical protein